MSAGRTEHRAHLRTRSAGRANRGTGRARARSGEEGTNPGRNHVLDPATAVLPRRPYARLLGPRLPGSRLRGSGCLSRFHAEGIERHPGVLALEKGVVLVAQLAGLSVELDLLERSQRH